MQRCARQGAITIKDRGVIPHHTCPTVLVRRVDGSRERICAFQQDAFAEAAVQRKLGRVIIRAQKAIPYGSGGSAAERGISGRPVFPPPTGAALISRSAS